MISYESELVHAYQIFLEPFHLFHPLERPLEVSVVGCHVSSMYDYIVHVGGYTFQALQLFIHFSLEKF